MVSDKLTAAGTGPNAGKPESNHVTLRGALAADPTMRTLPSGDELCTFRVTVRRPPGGRGAVDCIDCASTKARVLTSARRCQPGDIVEVTGSLRRRFWRGGNGAPTSRYEVEVSSLRRERR